MAKEVKFTKAEINKARRSRPVKVHLCESHDMVCGKVSGLENRIKEYVKNIPLWETFRWEDGTKLKISELMIDADWVGYDGGCNIEIYAVKIIPEPDERVIRKLKEKIKRKDREAKVKETVRKRELTLLKTLKAKYKDKA